jgi:O-antigen biosynthesis protein
VRGNINMSLCDIIIPVWNEREFIEKCVESIKKNTVLSYRIIIVDNASDTETSCYLEGLSKKNEGPLILIRNEENAGFPRAVNQGIAVSSAPYICVLNSDIEVYEGWLEEMIKIAESDPLTGMVNPSSNNLGQSYPLPGLSGEWIEMSACIGFCMLIKKEVIAKIGILDEIYSPGNFEDTDFSRRAVNAGYKCVMAKGAYVYHAQNTGFKKRKDWDEKFKRNRDIFNKKWGKIERAAYIITIAGENKYGLIKEKVNNLLRAGHFVHIIFKHDVACSGIRGHASLKIFRKKNNLNILWRVLTRKKRFDRIFTDSKHLAGIFRFFGHNAEYMDL